LICSVVLQGRYNFRIPCTFAYTPYQTAILEIQVQYVGQRHRPKDAMLSQIIHKVNQGVFGVFAHTISSFSVYGGQGFVYAYIVQEQLVQKVDSEHLHVYAIATMEDGEGVVV
jgi:hypothetical protein